MAVIPCVVNTTEYKSDRQDKTALPCLVRVGGVNKIGDKTRQFCLVSIQFPIYNCPVSTILRTTKNCLDLSPIQFTPPTWTTQRQSCLVRVGGKSRQEHASELCQLQLRSRKFATLCLQLCAPATVPTLSASNLILITSSITSKHFYRATLC